MEIRILGAHNIESATSRLTCLLVDGILAVDAGALTSGLTLPEQEALKSILLTHRHYDHVRDIAAIGINTSFFERNVRVHAQADTLEALSAHFLNRIIYPDFTAVPSANPALTFCPLEPYRQQEIEGYAVLAVPTRHTDTVGYQVTSREGRSFFYTGDTGPGLSSCWEHVSPEFSSDHLTPRLLGEELALLRKARGHLPRIVPIHLSPMYESEIAEELGWVARELDARIDIAREDMRLSL
jgi:ribonuclease BN (tRNA processing enzyme)